MRLTVEEAKRLVFRHTEGVPRPYGLRDPRERTAAIRGRVAKLNTPDLMRLLVVGGALAHAVGLTREEKTDLVDTLDAAHREEWKRHKNERGKRHEETQ